MRLETSAGSKWRGKGRGGLFGWLVLSVAINRRATDGPATGSALNEETARRAMLEIVGRDMVVRLFEIWQR